MRSAAFAMLLAAGAMSCSTHPIDRTLEFVIPNDFSGPFVVIEDREGEDVRWAAGHARVQLPSCGVLRVRSDEVFRVMKVYEVRRESGERVPTEDFATANEIALRFGGWNSRSSIDRGVGRFEYFVGTEPQFEAFDFSTFSTPSCNQDTGVAGGE